MNDYYVGRITTGRKVQISEDSPNRHIVITGISGSGKSVRTEEIEKHIIHDGGTVLELDVNGTHEMLGGDCYHTISACRDGLDVNLFAFSDSGSRAGRIAAAVDILSSCCDMGSRQKEILRAAVENAMLSENGTPSDMEKIGAELRTMDTIDARVVYDKLWQVFEEDIFRRSGRQILRREINVISFSGLDTTAQTLAVKIMLAVIWKQLRMQKASGVEITIIVDEFQNLSLKRNSVLYQMLTEGRKYGVNLILATQSMSVFSKIEMAALDQAAVRLYFRQSQSDIKSVAAFIEPKNKEYWISKLKKLPVGAAVTVGDLSISGRAVQRPIVTYSEYGEKPGLLN